MTGIAAGWASGAPVFERGDRPGGICASYYLAPDGQPRTEPEDGAYRFEVGGGHWIWGGDPFVMRLLNSIAPLRSYRRRAEVYLPDLGVMAPYPLQNHLHRLGPELASRALDHIVAASALRTSPRTMQEWVRANFGDTLCELFFDSFHELYTAGLWKEVAPQDPAKSPIRLPAVVRGALGDAVPSGYNTTFFYPEGGLGRLAAQLATRCDVRYGKEAVAVDAGERVVRFADGTDVRFDILVSTLPLRHMVELAGLALDEEPDPYTSVAVVNIGARRGPKCPDSHWVYVPVSAEGFHRVGFYSHVDEDFLPASARHRDTHVAIYVEKAFRPGMALAPEPQGFAERVGRELRSWGWIDDVEVSDLTVVDVAYTWARPGSRWRDAALGQLAEQGIYQVGRYGRWAPEVTSQGITQSIRDGLMAGASVR